MKDEMELVQEMENIDDRDTDIYIEKLEKIMQAKSAAVKTLRFELDSFQKYRNPSLNVK